MPKDDRRRKRKPRKPPKHKRPRQKAKRAKSSKRGKSPKPAKPSKRGKSSKRAKSRRSRKPPKPAPRKNTKVTGERSEANFLGKATYRNLGIAKPWGDSRRYDFIVDNGERLHRIQVKCTESIRADAYETRATYTTGKGRAPYTKKDIDFIAAHVVPLDIWYIIPVEVCTPAPMLRFYPHRKAKRMRLEPYREAWHLIEARQKDEDTTIEIQASADETVYPEPVDDLPAPIDPQLAAYHYANRPWPVPRRLKVLHARKGKRILPDPPKKPRGG